MGYRTDNGAAGAGDILAHHLVGDTTTRALTASAASKFAPALSPGVTVMDLTH